MLVRTADCGEMDVVRKDSEESCFVGKTGTMGTSHILLSRDFSRAAW